MAKIKQRIFSGSVCEQEIFTVSDRARNLKNAEPRLRFKTEEEREQHKEQIAQRRHTQQFNATYNPQSLYSTLTLNNENEVHTYEEAYHIGTLYLRRLKRVNPKAQISLYMGNGKTTSRIHFHMVSNGLTEEEITGKWGYGQITRIEHLREQNYYDGVNYGQDYTGLANYLFGHRVIGQSGHRCRTTRNMVKPDKEEATIIKRKYSENKPPRMPKEYKLVEYKSNEFGYQYFKFVQEVKKTAKPMKC